MHQLSRTLARAVASAWFFCLILGSASAEAAPVQARIEVHPISPTGMFGLPTDQAFVPAGQGSYSLAELYAVRDVDYLILLSGGSGDFAVLRLDSAGSIGGVVQQGQVVGTGWRAMGVVESSVGFHLHLAKGADGEMLSYAIDGAGQVDLTSAQALSAPSVENANVFDLFGMSGPRLFAHDMFSGKTVIQRSAFPWGKVGTESVSTGWSTADHIDVDGQVYRLTYKEAGEPYTPLGTSPTEEGRTRIVSLDGRGLGASVLYDDVLLSGFQLTRFVQVDAATYGFITYRNDGFTILRAFDPTTTATTGTVMGMSSTGPWYDEVQTYRRDGKTFMVGVQMETDHDPTMKLDLDKMGRLAQCVHSNLAHRAVGYQLSVAQGGRQLLSRAHGYKRLSPSSLPMTRNTVINLGSVGKLMTTITSLKMADNGDLKLNASVASQLDPGEYPATDNWATARTPYDLMAQVSGYDSSTTPGCLENDALELDCTQFFSTAPPAVCAVVPPPGQLNCPRSYVNTHFTALRVLNQTAAGISTSAEIDQLTKSLWLDDVVKDGPSCRDDMQSKYFQFCQDGDTCFPLGGEKYTQTDPNRVGGWSRNCGAGGWQGTADDMVSVLEALEGRGILSPANTDLMLDTGVQDVNGNATAVGFEPAYVSRSGGSPVLGKNGAGATTSFATMLDGGGQAVLSINSKRGSPEADELFKYAYDFATGATPECTPMLALSVRDDVVSARDASEVAIDRVPASSRFVVATRGTGGNIEVATYKRVGHAVVEDDWMSTEPGTGVELLGVKSNRFVTSMRNNAGDRVLKSYYIDALGNISLNDTAPLVPTLTVKLAKVNGGIDVDFVTSEITTTNQIRLTAWDIAFDGSLVQRGSYTSPDTFWEAPVSHTASNLQVIVASRTITGLVRPIVFDISADGLTFTRSGEAFLEDSPNGFDVRIVHVQKEDYTSFYVTAYRSGGAFAQTGWQITPAGLSVVPVLSRPGGAIKSLGEMPRSVMRPYYVVPLIDTQDRGRPMGYRVTDSSIDGSDAPAIGTASAIATLFQFALGRNWSTAAMVTGGKLRIVNVEAMSGPP